MPEVLRILSTQCSTGITRHTPVSSRTQRYGTYLRPIGQAGTLELLRKETAIEVGEPFLDSRAVVHPTESNLGQIENLCRTEAKAQEMEEEEIVTTHTVRPNLLFSA